MKIKVAPSILSADFSCLEKEIKAVEKAGADLLHVDVMDGHFVPNITIGPVVVESIRKVTRLPLDVHLMIENPFRYSEMFAKAGSDMLTFHVETVIPAECEKKFQELRARGVKIGISLNPATPFSKIKEFLDTIDFVLVMTVNPGFGGQQFMSEVIPKIKELRSFFQKDIAIDGGINDVTGKEVVAAGANVLAAGSYIFKSSDYTKAIRSLQCLC
ncbi:MAG: ribulose-phosphate 3-epimerase [Candidatus Omnitrophica bacterium]|nr:ribulose-phosphate 3-epimerase [Candidatus Omnitrophota bacterium]